MTIAVARANPDALHAEPGNHLELASLVVGEGCDGQISVTWVRIDGRHRRLRTRRSTRVYVVLDGALTISDDDGPAAVAAGEVATIPRGVAYALHGAATYLVINGPAFAAGDDEYL